MTFKNIKEYSVNKILLIIALLSLSSISYAKTCVGKVKEINHWSDGQENMVNFTLVNGSNRIKVSTKTKEQVSFVLTALASGMDTKVYWSCTGTKPPSCNETDTFPICGYISVSAE